MLVVYIQMIGRFVKQKMVGLLSKSARYQGSLFLAAGQGDETALGQVPHPHPAQRHSSNPMVFSGIGLQ